MPLAPSGELTSIGLGRETAGYGVAATPTVFIAADNVSFDATNQFNEKPGARKRVGRTRPNTGMFMGKGSADFELDPDTVGALLALTMGSETYVINPNSPGSSATVSTTSAAKIPPGWQTVTPVAMTGISPGAALTVGTGGTIETVIVKAVTTSSFTAFFKNNHGLPPITIVNAAIAPAWDHTFKLSSPRPSFTAQINRVQDAKNCVGNKVSQLSISASSKSILTAKLTTEYQTEILVGSPVTPAYSTLDAFSYEDPGNAGLIAGLPSTATLQSWTVDINTGLTTDFPNFNGGRLRGQLPETITKVSGSMSLAFESEDLMEAFWGNIGNATSGATGPQTIVLPVPLQFSFQAVDNVNSVVPYGLTVTIPCAMISTNAVPIKAGSYLVQNVKFDAYESTNGAGDDVSFLVTNGNVNAASI